MVVRFASICDRCQSRSEEYCAYPVCRECMDDVCPKCIVTDSLDLESGRCLCKRCEAVARSATP